MLEVIDHYQIFLNGDSILRICRSMELLIEGLLNFAASAADTINLSIVFDHTTSWLHNSFCMPCLLSIPLFSVISTPSPCKKKAKVSTQVQTYSCAETAKAADWPPFELSSLFPEFPTRPTRAAPETPGARSRAGLGNRATGTCRAFPDGSPTSGSCRAYLHPFPPSAAAPDTPRAGQRAAPEPRQPASCRWGSCDRAAPKGRRQDRQWGPGARGRSPRAGQVASGPGARRLPPL